MKHIPVSNDYVHRSKTMMDGSLGQNAWFFALGCNRRAIVGGQERLGYIPGPTSAQGYDLVQFSELFVAVPLNDLSAVILQV